MTFPVTLTVIVAVQHGWENLPDIFGALQPLRHQDVELIVCHGDADSMTPTLVPKSANLRTLRGAPPFARPRPLDGHSLCGRGRW